MNEELIVKYVKHQEKLEKQEEKQRTAYDPFEGGRLL